MSRKPPRSSSTSDGPAVTHSADRSDRSEPTVPTGIKIICVLRVLINLVTLYVGFAMLAESPVGLLVLALVAADMAVVYGLLTLQHWAWTWAVLLGAVNVVLTLLPPGSRPLAALVAALIVVYIAAKKSVYERARSNRRGRRGTDPEDDLVGRSR